MNIPATIRIFLPYGDAQGLRIAEISNWSGIALAAPRSDLRQLTDRAELGGAGVYVLLGADLESGTSQAYIGEAEVLRARLRQHLDRDFWVQAVVVASKDENLSKGHIRYLEARLIEEATAIGRVSLTNSQSGRGRLSEADAADMEVFLSRVRQLLPLLGTNMLVPTDDTPDLPAATRLQCRILGLTAYGRRSSVGFIVYKDSQAVPDLRPSAGDRARNIREHLIQSGAMVLEGDHYRFVKDAEFTSPSLAAVAVCGGSMNGLTAWKDEAGRTLRELEEG